MAAGVPVVAEARGGIPEIVVSGENGLLARTLDEIGDHLRRLRENPPFTSISVAEHALPLKDSL